MQYVGSTINKFQSRIRFNNHKSRLNSHVKLTAENRVKDDIIYKHFNQPDHRGLKDVRIQLVDKGSNERSLREREAQWAYRLRTIYPTGLNSDDFFSSRNLGGICFKILIVLSFNPYALNYCIFICCIFSCTEGHALASVRALAI